MINLSVTVYSSTNEPMNATVFSKMYSGRILQFLISTQCNADVATAYLSVRGYSSSYTNVGINW
jgi:hypothetical protein